MQLPALNRARNITSRLRKSNKMRVAALMSLTALALAHPRQPPKPDSACSANNLIVQAPSGTYQGLVNGSAPHVRQFLGVPYAQKPIGDLRWAPPQKLETNCTHKYDATRFPPSCPQYISPIPDIFNQAVPEFLIRGPVSEDCLSLGIWTPAEAHGLPVIVFITGGAFTTGGVDIDYQLPHHWVERTQSHIVVTMNYRLNIFGFPNAAGLDEQNLGIFDQRMGLEWVRDNIEAFGGDPTKITLWGQSAGAASVDYHNFAFAEDPIFASFFATSGSVFLGISSPDAAHSNFTFVARQLNCPNETTTPAEELSCMRQIPMEKIISTAGPYIANNSVSFYPKPDEKVIFQNYTSRYLQGKFSNRPAIFSTAEMEGNAVAPFHPEGVDHEAAVMATKQLFLCPATLTTRLRTQAGLQTYRYLYSGNFSNISPLPWMGAYHDSDLPMIFGTHGDFRGESTEFEERTSEKMQDAVLAFVENPYAGPEKVGWPSAKSGKMVIFGDEQQAMQEVSLESVQGVCADEAEMAG